MGHALLNNTMAYVGDTPWHSLGVPVPPKVTAAEMIVKAGLDWQVRLTPASGALQQSKRRYNRYRLARDPIGTELEPVEFAIVSARYEPLQNSEAFAFFDPVIRGGHASFESAGALFDGEVVWVQARLNRPMKIGDDEISPFLLLSTRHDGAGSVTARFTPVRVVCQNTLNYALGKTGAHYSIPHTREVVARVRAAGHDALLTVVDEAFDTASRDFGLLQSAPAPSRAVEALIDQVYAKPSPRQGAKGPPRAPSLWEQVHERIAVQRAGGDPAGADNWWGIYNAVTFVEDSAAADTKDKPSALNRIWFGSAADRKLRALRLITEQAREAA